MAKVFIEEATLTAIGDAIREKTEKEELLSPSAMPSEIRSITTQAEGETEGFPKNRTPEEVYASDRPTEWPVLPTPTQENEFYFLCGKQASSKNVATPTPFAGETAHVEWGYIDDNGAFISVYSKDITGAAGEYWRATAIPTANYDSRMNTYYVIRTTGCDTSREQVSSIQTTSYMRHVLEIKVRATNPLFKSDVSNTVYNFPACQFITFYGPQNWTSVKCKFSYMYGLRAILFDSEENNPFLHDNEALTDASYMFYYNNALRCYYPFYNWSNCTVIDYIYTNAYGLYDQCYIIEGNTKYAFNKAINGTVFRLSMKVPNTTVNIPLSSSVKYIENLDVSGYTATSHQKLNTLTVNAVEILNIKVGGALKLNTSNVLHNSSNVTDNYNSFKYLQKATMSPEQTGDEMPTHWAIAFPCMSHKNIKLFLETLPTVTGSHTLLIYNNTYGRATAFPPIDLLELATSKGYTISFTWGV